MKNFKLFLKKNLLYGTLVLFPILITFWLFSHLIFTLDKLVQPLIKALLPAEIESLFPFNFPGYGTIFTVIIVLITGVIAKNYLGQYFIKLSEKLLQHLPLLPTVYNALKQIFSVILSDKNDTYNGTALVEYPRKGVYSIAFITGKPIKQFKEAIKTDALINLFVPTTPNPTSGFYIIAKEEDIIKLDLSIEKALQLILSCGSMSE